MSAKAAMARRNKYGNVSTAAETTIAAASSTNYKSTTSKYEVPETSSLNRKI